MRTIATALVLAGCAAPLAAQEIDYQAGQYEYAQTADPAQDNDVVTETPVPVAVPAERVIMTRQDGSVPVFVARPVVQPLPGRVVVTAPVAVARPAAERTPLAVRPAPAPGQAPILYAYPGTAAARSIPGRDPALVAPSPYEMPQGYVMATAPLPAGAQLVAFDRDAWLGACRDRLATYPEADRDAVLAGLGGAALGHVEGRDGCETYLDSYLANAAARAMEPLPVSAPPGQAYMLVPVTIMVAGEPGK